MFPETFEPFAICICIESVTVTELIVLPGIFSRESANFREIESGSDEITLPTAGLEPIRTV
jgi:hypothetical protein